MAVRFMSPEHVAAMNAILEADENVRAACAELEKPVTLGYRLTDGPDGETVHWRMTFTDTVRFSLDDTEADLLLTGDWATMVRASRAQREGQVIDPGVVPTGDLSAIQATSRVFALAQAVATVPVAFPEV